MENVCFFKRVFEPLTLLLQDQGASLSLPADPGRVFPSVWRPQHSFLYKKVSFSWVQLVRDPAVNPSNPFLDPAV